MKETLLFLVALFMLTTVSVSAATFKTGDVYEYKGDVVADDIYIAAGSIDVTSNIEGDGIFAGGDISVLGDVSEDLTAAGGAIRLLGSVGDDMRVAGGNITVSGNIAGDLVAAGGFIKILSGSSVSGDTVIAGGAVVVNGAISGDLTVYGEEVTINGPITGNVTLKFTKKVTLGENASIKGDLTYSAVEDIVIPSGALVGGKVTRVEPMMNKFDFDKKDIGKFMGIFFLGKLLLMLVVSVLAVLLFKQLSKIVSVQAYDNFWKHALVGFITLIVVPIVAVMLLATIVGAYVGMLILGAYVLALFVSKVFAGIVAGALLSKWIKKEIIVDWKWVVLGVVALEIVSFVPVVGGLACFLITLTAFGTLLVLMHKKFWLAR